MIIITLLAAAAVVTPGAISGTVTYKNGYGEPRGDPNGTVILIPFKDQAWVQQLNARDKKLLGLGVAPMALQQTKGHADGFGHYKIVNLVPGTYLAFASTIIPMGSIGNYGRKNCSEKLPTIVEPPTSVSSAVSCEVVEIYSGQESEQGFQLGD